MATVALKFYSTSIGKKVVMAVTGFLLFGFLLVHMLGNAQLYLGSRQLNAYAAFLSSKPSLVWFTRITLLLAVTLHAIAAAQVWLQNRASRPIGYQMQQYRETSYAARTMIWGGPIIALFVVYHLLHFTTGHLHGTFNKADVYGNVVAGFKVWWISAVYILANLLVGLHLFHGLWSWMQTLGMNHPKYNPWRKNLAAVFAGLIASINVSFPVAVLMGLIK
ncbi:MAG: succinate dehydrogenase cytochrome b subunit [bacterium]